MALSNKLFYRALLVSLILHTGILAYLSLKKLKLFSKNTEPLKVTYREIKTEIVQESEEPPQKMELLKDQTLQEHLNNSAKKIDGLASLSESLGGSILKPSTDLSTEKIPLPSADIWGQERMISVPVIESEKINNPSYLSYTDNIRNKIRQRAYNYINHPDFQAGEVYVTFILTANGKLKEVKILENRTHANDYLKNVSVRSVEESSPFMPFPSSLTYPELTFNIMISFEMKEE